LGKPLVERGISSELGRKIIIILIDALYDMLRQVAGDSTESYVWVVDCRNAMPELTDWNDEIHGTSKGFANVAQRFRRTLSISSVQC